MMKQRYLTILMLFLSLSFLALTPVTRSFAQEKKKGDLEDFADDYGEEESSDGDSESDGSAEFFLWLFFDNIDDFARLWGKAPGTEFGPFPGYPYAEGNGFMVPGEEYRSYFFNTEFSYQYLNTNLRSYQFKWETQFVRRSKLSFDLSVYEEALQDDFGPYKDHLTFWGVRYGYAILRTPNLIANIEGGFRGFYRNSTHGGPEIALDLQLFPKQPLILETELAAAYVSNGPLYTVESSLGVALGRFELLAGLRILKNESSDLLDGFRFGLRIWY